jgi:hypothetical protein
MAVKYKEYKPDEHTWSDEVNTAQKDAEYWNGQQLKDFTIDDFKDSNRTTDYYNQMSGLVKPTWDKSNNTWWNKLTDTMNAIENREKFSYDVNGDALYQQYKDQYIQGGKMAMMDTMGQASAMTGGYGNSYAQSVGQQAYQGYLTQLTDKIPELYKMALDKYNSEGDEMYKRLSSYGSLYDTEYGEHRDAVSDYNADRSYLGDMWSKSHAMDVDEYGLKFDKALAENESYNSNIEKNRTFYNDVYNNLKNTEWGMYMDNETLKKIAIEVANENLYKNASLEEDQRQFDKQFEASTGYTTSGQKSTTFPKEEEFTPYQYAYTNTDGQTIYNYDGKEVKVQTGLNPYTRTKNPDAKHGTFANGYQPNNVGVIKKNGKEVVNKLSKSGKTDVVNGVTQNVWKDLNGQLWIWDGTQNAYLRYEE